MIWRRRGRFSGNGTDGECVKIGFGYDVHRLVAERRLVLCGVEIPYEMGLLGHSDADVAVHAVMDAVLGALALGDIGKLFPDSDSRFKDADSMKLLEIFVGLMREKGFALGNLDVTIVAEKPKLAAIDAIALFEGGLAELCDVTVAVTAPEEARIQRLMARDGIDRDYAKRRIDAQKNADWFRQNCDYCLENNGTQAQFRSDCLAFLRKLAIIEETETECN